MRTPKSCMSATPSAAYSAAKARYACADQEPRDRARALQDPCERDCTRTTDLQRDAPARPQRSAGRRSGSAFVLASNQASFITGVVPSVDGGVMAGSAGCSFTKGSLWRSLRPDTFRKRHESLKQRRCSANELAKTPAEKTWRSLP